MSSLPAATVLSREFPRPLVGLAPPAVSSAGERAIDLASDAGLVLDPWQAWALDQSLRRRADGKWAAGTAALIVPRQNGKGAVLEARCLAGLFLFGERRVVFTAHQFKTAKDHYTRIVELIDQTPGLKRRVRSTPSGKGDEAVILRDGRELRFIARSTVSGRGMGGDCVILDEAFEIPESVPAALLPVMAARSVHGNPQLWYTSSPVNQREHKHGAVLARVRRRALRGAPSLLWLEWAAGERTELSDDELAALLDDREALARANPGLGVRISVEWVEQTERPNMSDRAAEVERLGIGDWPAEDDDLQWEVVPRSTWSARSGATRLAAPPESVAYAVAGSWPNAAMCSLARSWRGADGQRVVELVDRRPGSAWLVPELSRLADGDPEPVAIVLAAGGTAAAQLAGPLQEAGVEVVYATTREEAQAAGQLVAGVGAVDGEPADTLHYGQPKLDAAVGGASRHHVGDVWRWDRDSASDPVEAVGLARWGHVTRGYLADEEPWGFRA